jgi:hypothetical protein
MKFETFIAALLLGTALFLGCSVTPHKWPEQIVADPPQVYTPGSTNLADQIGEAIFWVNLEADLTNTFGTVLILTCDPIYWCPTGIQAAALLSKSPVEWTEGSWDCEDQCLSAIVMARLAVHSVLRLEGAGLACGLAAFISPTREEGHALVIIRTTDGWFLFDPQIGDFVPRPGGDWRLVWALF